MSTSVTQERPRRRLRKLVLWGVLATIGLVAYLGRTWLRAWWNDRPVEQHWAAGTVDDASRQNSAPIQEVWTIPQDRSLAESQLAALLKRADENQLKVSIAGSRHSMGGHTISPQGISINMLPFHELRLNREKTLLTSGSGSRWSEVVPYLDERGISVAVMQSNNDFSIGGSVSVNCHGWQQNSPPIASTVESLRLMKPDGSIVVCSRTENRELFSHVLGGYGLFGVILDVELRVVPNENYQPESQVVPSAEYVTRFRQTVNPSRDFGMVYGRLCVVPGEETFLKQAVLTVFRRLPGRPTPLSQKPTAEKDTLKREIFRGQIGSLDGKKLRWKLESSLGEQVGRESISRNRLLNESARIFQEQNADRVDILQEYFIPSEQVEAFLVQARTIIPRHQGELLNVTIRNVLEDTDTVLRYADQEMFAFVMLFDQELSSQADMQMANMTQELIAAAINLHGRYYLPYRLHADPAQLRLAYPQSEAFFAKKREYDPGELFSNRFYEVYGGR